MITKDSLIFIVEDDKPYGTLIQSYIKKLGFQRVILFHDEKHCLDNMCEYPNVLITDYNLNYMSGLKLIQEAMKINPGIYSILLSGVYHNERYSDDISLQKIDKYIMKGVNELQQLSETLDNFKDSVYNEKFY